MPQDPEYLFLLPICWGGLAISILSGILALIGSAQTPLDVAVSLSRHRYEQRDNETIRHLNVTNGISQRESVPYQIEERLLIGSFAIALVSLAVFAILNVSNV